MIQDDVLRKMLVVELQKILPHLADVHVARHLLLFLVGPGSTGPPSEVVLEEAAEGARVEEALNVRSDKVDYLDGRLAAVVVPAAFVAQRRVALLQFPAQAPDTVRGYGVDARERFATNLKSEGKIKSRLAHADGH
jgi:hypothetical protein